MYMHFCFVFLYHNETNVLCRTAECAAVLECVSIGGSHLTQDDQDAKAHPTVFNEHPGTLQTQGPVRQHNLYVS